MIESLGMKNTQGALIADVVEDSPADIAGLKAGDVILEVDNKKVNNASKLKLLISSNINFSDDSVKYSDLIKGITFLV